MASQNKIIEMIGANYCVYKHTCPNGKVYIGITSQNPVARWKCGNGYAKSYFGKAINKYGWDNIKHEILYTNLSKEEACQKEIELIAEYKSNQREFGYNICFGGQVNFPTDEIRKKLSERQIGEKNHNFGKHLTEECKKKKSEALKGEKAPWYGKHFSEEHRRKIGEASRGRIYSEESRRKISKANGKTVICIETQKVYVSAREASRETKITNTSISSVCNGKRKTAGGYHWQYKEV